MTPRSQRHKEITDSVAAGHSKRFPRKHLGEVTWYMGIEYKRYREMRMLKMVRTEFIQPVDERFGITKTSPISASPTLDLRHVSDEKTVVGANFPEIVGSPMWISKPTKSDISHAVRAIARFSNDPKDVHEKAGRNVLLHLSGRAHLGLAFRREAR